MLNIHLMQYKTFIFLFFCCSISLPVHATTKTEIKSKLTSSFNILIRELPKIKSNEESTEFIRTLVLPIMDMPTTSRLMLGKHWKYATELQKKRFITAMTEQLINIYSVFLVNANSNVKFDIVRISKHKGKRADKYVVYSKVTSTVPVDVIFKIYKRTGRDWKIVDISIEGISIVLNWRNTFGDLIKTPADLETVIVKLENKALEIQQNVE